jgi:dihydrofolate reductase
MDNCEVTMAELIYSAIMSLDGYIEDPSGNFDWAEPDEEVHRFINDLERGVGTYLYGRRMYETMAWWETEPNLAAHAFRAGLVDQCYLFLAPIIVGGGKRALPEDVRLKLELEDQRRFGNGMVYLSYRVRG